MRTIQVTIEDDLVKAVDRVSKELGTSRSASARKARYDFLITSLPPSKMMSSGRTICFALDI